MHGILQKGKKVRIIKSSIDQNTLIREFQNFWKTNWQFSLSLPLYIHTYIYIYILTCLFFFRLLYGSLKLKKYTKITDMKNRSFLRAHIIIIFHSIQPTKFLTSSNRPPLLLYGLHLQAVMAFNSISLGHHIDLNFNLTVPLNTPTSELYCW